MKKFDDVSWHFGGKFPDNLDREQAGVHIGMYLGWLIRRGLASTFLEEIAPEELTQVRNRTISGKDILFNFCDEKLTSEDVNEVGERFTTAYYESDEYIDDYSDVFADSVETLYHVQDTDSNSRRIEIKIDEAFDSWKKNDHLS